jgi:ABC-type nitrate/sulfonate/bicarbonate transport system permease component
LSIAAVPASATTFQRVLPRPRLIDPAGVVGLIVAIALWSLGSHILGPTLPPPADVLRNAWENITSSTKLPGIGLPRGGYLPHLLFTTGNVLVGGFVGAAVGVATGLASAEDKRCHDLIDPVVTVFGTIPIVILAPFFLMWFGLSGVAGVALVAIYTGAVLHLFTLRGVNNLSPAYTDFAATLGASRWQRLIWVRLPGALPEIFGGLRIAVAGGWGLSAVTEMLGGRFGAGRVIVALRAVYDLTGIMAVVLSLCVFAMGFDGVLLVARRLALRWADTARGAEGEP